jgi:hypothetical protein
MVHRDEDCIGEVVNVFRKAAPNGVAHVRLKQPLKIGDMIMFTTSGGKARFIQVVTSMQINHRIVTEAGPGADIAILIVPPRMDDKFPERIQKGDLVFVVEKSSWLSTGIGELHFLGLEVTKAGGRRIDIEEEKKSG